MKRHFSSHHVFRGTVRPPGDKSISHRALILGSMATGSSRLTHVATGDDVASTRRCLQRLGMKIAEESRELRIEGMGESFGEGEEPVDLDARNSATTMRLLMGALAPTPREFRLVGDASLSRRPMDRIAEPLRRMGAEVDLEEDRHAPVRLLGGPLKGISYELPVASAQVKGAVLLAGLRAEGVTDIGEARVSRDHTERLLSWLGVEVVEKDGRIHLTPRERAFNGFDLAVPGDFSSAAYLMVAACLAEDADVTIENVGLNPTRLGLVDVLREMGAEIEVEVVTEQPEPSGTIRVRSSRLRAVTASGETIPRCIDELPLIGVAATQAEGTTEVKDAAELRHKETDRISALVDGLRSIGAEIDELDDGFAVHGPTRLKGGVADARGDHRLALAFAVAGLASTEGVHVGGWEATRISYPTFQQDLDRISR